MEIYLKFAVCTFLILNIAFIINLFSKPTKEVEPKLIGSSEVIEEKSPSKLVNSLKESLMKYFKPQDSSSNIEDILKINPEVLLHENSLKFSKDSRISMFLESFNKKDIYVVKLNYQVPSESQATSGEMSLYAINAASLINKERDLGESNIRKCWTTKVQGRIIGVVTSDNKQSIAIYYRKPVGKKNDYRVRFIHRLHCENIEIEQADIDNKVYRKAYFNDNSYDDFIIRGNSPVTYIAIQENTLAFSRDKDDFRFQILKRIKKEGENRWKVALLGPKIKKQETLYFHTNSLKFIPDSSNEFRLLQVYISISKDSGVALNGDMSSGSSSEEEIESDDRVTTTQFFEHVLDEKVLSKNFNLEESMKNLKNYMKPTVFSNISEQSLFFEIYNSNILISMDWNEQTVQFQYLFDLKSKISRIYSEQSGENVIVKFEDDNDLVLIKREKNPTPENGEGFFKSATPYSVSLKNLPDKLQGKDFVSFSLEKIEGNTVLFALNNDGFFFALNFQDNQQNLQISDKFGVLGSLRDVILPNESSSFFEIILRYLVTNIIPLALYLKYYLSCTKKDSKLEKAKIDSLSQVNKIINKINKIESKINQEGIRNLISSGKAV